MLKIKDFKTHINYDSIDKIRTENCVINLETFKQGFCIKILESSYQIKDSNGFINGNIRYDNSCMVKVHNLSYNTKTTFKMKNMHIAEGVKLYYTILVLNLILAKSNLIV